MTLGIHPEALSLGYLRTRRVVEDLGAIRSRSGVTQMGLELARELGMIMIARAEGRHFLVYKGADRIEFDESASASSPERTQRSVPHSRAAD